VLIAVDARDLLDEILLDLELVTVEKGPNRGWG